MAVNEITGFLKYKDAAGDVNLLFPITTKDNVDGLDEIENELANAVKVTAQTLTEAQKAQARVNIGIGDTMLPDVSEDDNHKLLMVENGEWAAVSSSSLSMSYPIIEDDVQIRPEQYHVFGEVDSLSVTLVEGDDGKAHEYCFEFKPSENFTGLTITPEPSWANLPQYPAGKTCQVSILRGIGVMACA